ncbi:acyltransferase domain-containing protein, partial [Actinophytocola sediminis]
MNTPIATPIAIVGVGGLFTGSGDVRAFWHNVARGTDCLAEGPADHGGFLPPVPFAPARFGLPPALLAATNVVQPLSMVVAEATLADAGGHDPERTAVVLGVTGAGAADHTFSARLHDPLLARVLRAAGLSDARADEVVAEFDQLFTPWREHAFPGLLDGVVSARIANRFDLRGLNCTVDATSASSLAAVRIAMTELATGRADLVLTGGCDVENTAFMRLCFARAGVLSPTGRVRPFDAGGDGTLLGEGIGMLACKRLADAERDGDRVYAVLRGLGAGNDGRGNGILAPSAPGQARTLALAYAEAGIDPALVGLVECHGTGTPAGDRVELAALGQVYRDARPGSVALGSVKSQIGHTRGAAGVAGLLKAALALHHQVLPPTLGVERPHPALAGSPFHLADRARPWVVDPDRPRRVAAVSAFGFGGTNFHCVLTEADQPTRPAPAAALVRFWHAEDPAALFDTPGVGRAPADHARLAVVADGPEELARRWALAEDRLRAEPDVEEFDLPGAHYRRRGPVGRVAALFAGQGSQYPDMGRAVAVAVPAVRAAFDGASMALAADPPLGRVVFPPAEFDDDAPGRQRDALCRTDYAQAAVAALSVGQFRHLAGLGFAPDGMLGHSLGELSALCCAGALTDAELFELVAVRGRAMAAVPEPGGMVAVLASLAEIEEHVADTGLAVCNVNGPRQVVVGGGEDGLAAFLARCRHAGLRATRLPVAAAFHTERVGRAVEPFRRAVAEIGVRPPRVPVYPNSAGGRYGADRARNVATLADQLRQPVLFGPRVEQLYADGFRVFVEFGPKRVLGGLVGQILADRPDVVVLSVDPGPGGDGESALRQTVARLAVLGAVAVPPPPVAVPTPRTEDVVVLTGAGGRERPAPARTRVVGAESLLAEQLATHAEYLAGQLEVTTRLAALLEAGPVDQALADGVAAVTRHSEVVGEVHRRTTEVLGELARLAGRDRPAAPVTDAAPRPV